MQGNHWIVCSVSELSIYMNDAKKNENCNNATKALIQKCFDVEKHVHVWMQSSSLRDWHALRDPLESINTKTETHRLQIFHPVWNHSSNVQHDKQPEHAAFLMSVMGSLYWSVGFIKTQCVSRLSASRIIFDMTDVTEVSYSSETLCLWFIIPRIKGLGLILALLGTLQQKIDIVWSTLGTI